MNTSKQTDVHPRGAAYAQRAHEVLLRQHPICEHPRMPWQRLANNPMRPQGLTCAIYAFPQNNRWVPRHLVAALPLCRIILPWSK